MTSQDQCDKQDGSPTPERWIAARGAVNMRDLGGLVTDDGGHTRFGRLLRSDNLQGLTATDVTYLVDELRLRRVIDLRSDPEVQREGPGPLHERPEVSVHQLSLFTAAGRHTDVDAETLPWKNRPVPAPGGDRMAGVYLQYLRDRPDSVVDALRLISRDDGAALVHCAAGKDRTGVIVALALTVAGVTREAIVADYVATGERIPAVLARLRASPTYAADLDGSTDDSHMPRADTMRQMLSGMDDEYGGVLAFLEWRGWTEADTAALRSRLRD